MEFVAYTRACGSNAIAIETYKLSAKPSLISEGEFKGQLRAVEFIAVSPVETMQWFAINCGQFERSFSKLISRKLAAEIVDSLTRGEVVEFPGFYQQEQFAGGFHGEREPDFSIFSGYWLYAGLAKAQVTP
jgi:hypothetical protein